MQSMTLTEGSAYTPQVFAPPAQVLKYPNPLLARKSEPVGEVTPQIRSIVQRMMATMFAAPGFGLAAPQIGVLKRIITVNPARILSEPDFSPFTLVNPRVIKTDGAKIDEEGCLSLPGAYAWMARPEFAEIEYSTLEGESRTIVAHKYLARCLLHEIDHLDGILFWDHMSLTKRSASKLRYFSGTRWLL